MGLVGLVGRCKCGLGVGGLGGELGWGGGGTRARSPLGGGLGGELGWGGGGTRARSPLGGGLGGMAGPEGPGGTT